MSQAEEYAKAITETAKLGTTSVEAITKIGSFLSRVFGMPTENAVGIVGDKIEYTRWERQNRLIDKVNEEQAKRGLTQLRAVPPKFAIPIIINASIEEDDDLQDMWCKLLTNYSDPTFSIEIRYAFIDIIKNLTSIDTKILKCLYDISQCFYDTRIKPDTNDKTSNVRLIYSPSKSLFLPQIIEKINSSNYEIELSLSNLMRVQCINEVPRNYYGITPLGRAFVSACIK